jgi:type IV secretory pathway VirB2 component (pilin)
MSEVLNNPPPRSTPITGDSGPNVFSRPWSGWFRNIFNALSGGISTTVVLAKITAGGTNGSLTVQNGIITSYTAPT